MPRALWLIVIGNIINVTGGSFLWPLNTIYLHDHLGKSLSMAGFVLMLNSAASVIGNLIGGLLFDKIGGYKSIIFGAGITLLALVGLTVWHDWPHYMIFLIIIGFGSGIVNPVMYSLASASWKEGGRRAFNAVYVGANVGVAVGTALAGFIASISFEYIFISNTILYLAFFLIALFGYRKISAEAVYASAALKVNTKNTFDPAKRVKYYALFAISAGYALCWVGYVQWQTTIASYTQEINISLEQYSLLWTVNGALIVLAQPLLAKFLKHFAHSLKHQIVIGILIFIAAFSIAAVSSSFNGFLAAMVIMTLGEMLVWPAIPTIADHIAPKGKQGLFQGIINSAATAGRMVGPLLGGILVDLYGMSMLFIIMIALFAAAIFTSLFYDKGLKSFRKNNNSSESLSS